VTEKYLGGFQPDNKVQALCVLCSGGNAARRIHACTEQLNGKGQWDCPAARSAARAEKLRAYAVVAVRHCWNSSGLLNEMKSLPCEQ